MVGGVSLSMQEAERALYNAPFDEDGWRGAIELVRIAVGACTGNLVGMGGPQFVPLTFWVGRNADEASLVSAGPELWGTCNWRVNSVGGQMSIQHDRHYDAYREIADTSLYDDAMSDIDAARGCQSAVMMGESGFVGLALAWGRRTAGVDDDALERFAHLRFPLHRAIRMQMAFDGQAARLMLGTGAEGMHFLLDSYGQVCAMTEEAGALVASDAGVWLDNGRLALAHPFEQRSTERAFARMLDTHPLDLRVHENRVGRSAATPGGKWRLTMSRLPQRSHGLGFDPAVSITLRAITV